MHWALKINNLLVGILSFLLLCTTIYYNILYDIALVLLLFTTSYAVGRKLPFHNRFPISSSFLVKLALGLGCVGFAVWFCSLFKLPFRSLYLLFSAIAILIDPIGMWNELRQAWRCSRVVNKQCLFLIPLILLSIIPHLIAAASPIVRFDSLMKHLAVVSRMTCGEYEYNVVESIAFGDYALLSHALFSFVHTLGGTKAMVLCNVALSYGTLLSLLAIARSIARSIGLSLLISVIYLSTPIIFSLSTVLYVDIGAVFFVVVATLIVIKSTYHNIGNRTPIVSLILGFAFFAKTQAIFLVIPLALILIVMLSASLKRGQIKPYQCVLVSILSLVLFFLPFTPSMLIVWFKTGNPIFPFMNTLFNSVYFSNKDFAEYFKQFPLALNFKSLFHMVFETNRNVEMHNGGIGYYLLCVLVLPVAVAATFCFRSFSKINKWRFLLLSLIVFMAYLIAIRLTYNIRYFLSFLILSIIPCTILFELLFTLIKRSFIKSLCFLLVSILFALPNVFYLCNSVNGILTKNMMKPDPKLSNSGNESILKCINAYGTRVLSNNDVFRGEFKGEYFVLDWYNTYYIQKINEGRIKPAEFLASFDFYLFDKRLPPSRYVSSNMFSTNNLNIGKMLRIHAETDSHLLYCVDKSSPPSIVLNEVFSNGITVSVTNSHAIAFSNNYCSYSIALNAEALDMGAIGRWQINWITDDGRFLGASIIPFTLEPQIQEYVSPEITDIPKTAKHGILYLNSHSEKRIKMHSYRLYARKTNTSIVDFDLNAYRNQTIKSAIKKWVNN